MSMFVNKTRFSSCYSGSPFTVNVGGQGANRLRESITRERRAADITHIGSQCELLLKIPGKLSVDQYKRSPLSLSEIVFVDKMISYMTDQGD